MFVVLRGLERDNVFWSTYDPDQDMTKLSDGTVAYEIVGICETEAEAMCIWTQAYNKSVDRRLFGK